MLMDYFKNNAFFKRTMEERKGDNQTIQNLFSHLRIQECKARETVFLFGDRGKMFYIIIKGEVEIRTPSPVELENESATAEGILVFIVTYFDDIYWQKIYQGEKI